MGRVDEVDFIAYLSWDNDRLLNRLAEVTTLLVTQNRELAYTDAMLVRARHAIYLNSLETSHAAREREVDYGTVDLRASLAELHGEVEAAKDEKFFIIRLLDGREVVR